MQVSRSGLAKSVAALAAAGLVLSPAFAAGETKRRAPAVSLSFDPIATFTPAAADPRLAAALAGKSGSLTDLKFTPAPAKGRPSQVRVAIRARAPSAGSRDAVALAAASPVSALTPASYNLGVAVGWRRFAVAGDVAKSKDANAALGGRESAVVGVSYSLNPRLSGRVAVGAERGDGKALAALRQSDNYSVDVGGAFSLTKRIAVTGGVRYRVDKDRLSTLQDQRRDSQAVYVGTAFKF
ncbi:porin [Sphingomonas sp.]|uniref:porin n=1 Tax=Sphingomonas sp. TaxID=28214 RepID=UPI00286E7C6F|nr:porin [Sphingomonas sp.]